MEHRSSERATVRSWAAASSAAAILVATGAIVANASGFRPLLGVQLVEATPELRRHLGGDESRGVLVSKVLAGMPAEAAGLRVGDLIVEVAGDDVADSVDLAQALHSQAGESFAVELVRDRRAMTLEVSLPDADPEGTHAALAAPPRPPEPPPLRWRMALPAPPAPPVLALPPPPPAAPPAPHPRVERLRRSV